MKTLVYINFVLTLALIGVLSWFFALQKTNSIEKAPSISTNNIEYVDSCGTECKKQIDESVASSLSTVSATPKEVIKTVTVTPVPSTPKKQIAYVPISGTVTTTSTGWYDAPNTDFYLNAEGDYGKSFVVTWEAALKVAHGNGTAYARLFDVTHGIAVNGSDLALVNNPNLTQVYSQNLSFWSGNNLYRVQFRSLNGFEVTFGGGNLKIIY